MARRKGWESLSPAYRERLTRKGITGEAYERGASIRAARGHSSTPERPTAAFRQPDVFRDYLLRAERRGVELPPNLLTRPRDGRGVSPGVQWRNREALQRAIVTRLPGGDKAGARGVVIIEEADPETGEWRVTKTVVLPRNEFKSFIQKLKDEGVTVDIESQPYLGVTA